MILRARTLLMPHSGGIATALEQALKEGANICMYFLKICVITSSPHCLVSSSSPSQEAPPLGEGAGELQALERKRYNNSMQDASKDYGTYFCFAFPHHKSWSKIPKVPNHSSCHQLRALQLS